MEHELQSAEKRIAGTKQVLRALNGGTAAKVFLAKDADGFIYHRVQNLCSETAIPVAFVDTMQELGKLCGVSVKTAVAAVLK
ncbi:MAG: ribosomal L7Ae/L30e/S12e/Gadd45 family protein [Clostridia bacterium]|nr:ribosomal L7Ae/L30e/S12e/Gadd45 family protein [Clostridia bacterium]